MLESEICTTLELTTLLIWDKNVLSAPKKYKNGKSGEHLLRDLRTMKGLTGSYSFIEDQLQTGSNWNRDFVNSIQTFS